MSARCRHVLRVRGPHVPAFCGSRPTEVCCRCGAWRIDWVSIGIWKRDRWEPKNTLDRATKLEEDN